jgi:hypothetical protein
MLHPPRIQTITVPSHIQLYICFAINHVCSFDLILFHLLETSPAKIENGIDPSACNFSSGLAHAEPLFTRPNDIGD